MEQVVPQTTRHFRKSLEDFNVTLHEGRERIVVNSAGFFIRETRMERFSVTSRTISFSAASSACRHFDANSEDVSIEELEGQCPVSRQSISARKTRLNSVLQVLKNVKANNLYCSEPAKLNRKTCTVMNVSDIKTVKAELK